MGSSRYLVWGARGHAAVLADLLLADGHGVAGFVTDDRSRLGSAVEGFDERVIAIDADLRAALIAGHSLPGEADAIALGIGRNNIRSALAVLIPDATLPPLIHTSAAVSRRAVVRPGAVILALAVVNARAVIGRAAIVNSGAIVEHDCIVASAAHISPGAVLTGACIVEEGAWIGAGAVVLPEVRVGAHAIVGAGAVVVTNVPAGETVVGIPARTRRSS